ncbi:MAG: TrmB family transcriptional regulator [Nitrososphaeria archaeon]
MEDRFQILEKIGLTTYDIRIFQTLLNGGVMSAQEISRASRVPYPKVYTSLKKLIDMKWVKEEKGWPSRYYLASPDEILMRYKEEMEKRLTEFETFLERVVRPIYSSKGMTERFDVWLVNGLKAVMDTFIEAIKLAKREVKIAMPFEPAQSFIDQIKAVVVKNPELSVRVLTSENAAATVKRAIPKAEVRFRDAMFGGGVISDSKMVVLMLSMAQGDYTAIASNHPYLAMLAESYFSYLWEGAQSQI